MQTLRRYPVGVQVFGDIRSEGYMYADKTDYVWKLVSMGGKYRFLSRPRRFGKTLLVSTLEAYFQGRRELFEGLAIHELDDRENWPKHPVIRLDLSVCKSTSEEGLARDLDLVLRHAELGYGREEGIDGWSARLDTLIHRAAATSDEGVVVLIDEYDAPLLNVMHDSKRLQSFRETMREFYSPLKANEHDLRFLFITGITRFSQLSIFSELNNLLNISMLPQFAGICGITAEELDGPLAPDVAWLAERMDVDPAACREMLRERYDGYHFSRRSPDVYNPFSVVTAFETGEIDDYWFGSGTPTSLVNMLRAGSLELPDLEGVRASSASFDAATEGMGDPVAFMYQSGYLTIKDYDPRMHTYTLGIPNEEVRHGLYESLLPVYAGRPATASSGFVADFSSALFYDDDMGNALSHLRRFMAGMPYEMAPRCEKDFQTVLYLVFRLVGANIATEVRIASGRIDVVIDAPSTLYVMELKYRRSGEARPTSADAVAQIDDKGYLAPWAAGAKPVAKVGVVYSEDARTIDEDWVIACEA